MMRSEMEQAAEKMLAEHLKAGGNPRVTDSFENAKMDAARSLGQLNTQCAREKYWKECSIEEKIERLRHVMKSQERELEETRRHNRRLRARLERLTGHVHDQNGAVVVSIHSDELADECGGSIGRSKSEDPDSCYF